MRAGWGRKAERGFMIIENIPPVEQSGDTCIYMIYDGNTLFMAD